MKKRTHRLVKDVTWWAPHFNDVKTSGTLQAGAEVTLLDEDYEPHPTGEGRGHAYYHLEWDGGSGWTRTYDPNPFPPRWEPLVTENTCEPEEK